MASLTKKVILGSCFALMAAAGVGFYLHGRGFEHTDDAQIEGRITYISPKVSGYITKVAIEDNQHVKAGDPLLEIDPRDYEIRVRQAQAVIDAANAKLSASNETYETSVVTAPTTIDAAKAAVAGAQANYDRALSDYNRKRQLSDLAISKQGIVDARTAMEAAASALADAKAGAAKAETAPRTITSAQAATRQVGAEIEQATAALAQAQLDLSHTKIMAPFDGHITRRSIEPGAYVQPGQQILALVSDDYWVVANFKETQLDKMKPGSQVSIKIDAYPDRVYKGHIESFQKGTGARFSVFPPENATGNFVKVVQRVPVKIIFDEKPDPALALGPGMSVEPVVDVR